MKNHEKTEEKSDPFSLPNFQRFLFQSVMIQMCTKFRTFGFSVLKTNDRTLGFAPK